MRRLFAHYELFDAKAVSATSNPIFIADAHEIILSLSATLNSDMTIKVQTSMSEDAPDFSAAQSASNNWDYAEVIDNQDTSVVIKGDTGVVYSATSEAANTRKFTLNSNAARWFAITLTRVAGALTASVDLADNG